MRLRLWHKIMALAALPLAFGVMYFVCLGALLHDTYQASVRESQVRRAYDNVDKIIHLSVSMASTVWQYASTLSAEDLQKFRNKRQELLLVSNEIPGAAVTFPSVKNAAESSYAKFLSSLHMADSLVEVLPRKDALSQMQVGQLIRKLLLSSADVRESWSLTHKEFKKALNESGHDLSALVWQTRGAILIGMLLSAGVSLFAAHVLQKSVVQRLDRLSAFAAGLLRNQQAPSVAVATAPDEIDDLQRAYESMAVQISNSRRHERAIIDNAADVIFGLSRQETLLSVSPAVQAVLGFTPPEVVGKPIVEFIAATERSQFAQDISRSWKSDKPDIFETEMVTKSGAAVQVRVSAARSPDGEQLFCVAHDIAELVSREHQLRANEERFRVITERMPGSLLLLDEQHNIVRANQEAQVTTGLSQERLIGSDFRKLFRQDCALDGTLMQPGKTRRLQLARANESEAWVDVTIDEFHDRGERGYQAVLLDVTERVEFERLRDNLIAMLVHDISTPLSTMQGAFKLLALGKYGELTESGLNDAALGSHESTQLIRIFKEFVNIERYGAVRLDKGDEPVQLNAVLAQAAAALPVPAAQNQIEIVFERTTDIRVDADPHKVAQVVISMLSALMKQMPASSQIRLSTSVNADGQAMVSVEAATAIGKEVIEALASNQDDLSMTIARAVVEAHGGTVGFLPNAAQLWFTIPVSREAQATE